MTILFDNQIFKIQAYGGVSRYYAEILKGLGKSVEFEPLPRKLYSSNEHLRLNGLTYLDRFQDNYHFLGKTRIENYLKKREDDLIIETIRRGEFDVFHPTYYSPFFIKELPKGKPFVLTVFDMIHELYLDEKLGRIHDETKNKRELIPRATHIIAISENTKRDILRYYPALDEKKISVIYLGSSFSASNAKQEKSLSFKYILFVGNRNDYKNFEWFFKSVSVFLKRHAFILVCAGGGEFSESERLLFEDENLSNKVIHVSAKSDSDLAALYKGASCFIFPSLYEGFGIPILEAFSCQCPVLLPNSSCFPEIADNAALYYESNDPEDLVKQLERIVTDVDLSKSLKEAGVDRLQFFNWEKTVLQHTEVYDSLSRS